MNLSVLFKVILGFLALGAATVGLLLPVWPTTPFVLVAIGCFSSTPALRSRILRVPLFREYYDSYTTGKGIRRQTLLPSLTFMWGMLVLSSVMVGKLWISLLLLCIGAAVTLHLLWLARDRVKKDTDNR